MATLYISFKALSVSTSSLVLFGSAFNASSISSLKIYLGIIYTGVCLI